VPAADPPLGEAMIRADRFSTVPLFTGLEPAEIAEVLERTEAVEALPGDVLMRQGDPGPGLYLVASGSYLVCQEGVEEPLARLHELAHFGEISLITNEPCSASVICEEGGRLRLLPVERFGKRLRERDPLALLLVLNMARALAHRMVQSEKRLPFSTS
jgi:CRP/FNR family cyclic AMP-dependent transcriptional regulator